MSCGTTPAVARTGAAATPLAPAAATRTDAVRATAAFAEIGMRTNVANGNLVANLQSVPGSVAQQAPGDVVARRIGLAADDWRAAERVESAKAVQRVAVRARAG